MAEQPFTINIPDQALDTLRKKLELANLPDELDDAGWDYGAPLADVKRLATRWKDGYDWRHHEQALNDELPQFTRDIQVENHGTLNIHYVHKRSTDPNAIPLLFVHGWPGGFFEVRKLLPLLVTAPSGQPSFHVVAISLPGYGFSEAPKKKGFELKQYAEVGHKLMIALGYHEYVTQGGDWGGCYRPKASPRLWPHPRQSLAHQLPRREPPHPIHRPLLFLSFLFTPMSAKDKAKIDRIMQFQKDGAGYHALQSTKPQTLGYALADSPVGLLAWIYEKLVAWTDDYKWDDDEVLTWVTLYWFSRAGPAASLRIYYEYAKAYPDFLHRKEPTTIPMGYSYFPKEGMALPTKWLRAPNLVFESEHGRGGHFAAHEVPELLAGDLHRMFGMGGPAFGVVKANTGY